MSLACEMLLLKQYHIQGPRTLKLPERLGGLLASPLASATIALWCAYTKIAARTLVINVE